MKDPVAEVLRVENFGGLTSVELELGEITVLIGPQASGKSVLAKLVYFLRELLRTRGKELLDADPGDQTVLPGILKHFQRTFSLKGAMSGDFRVGYRSPGQQKIYLVVEPNDDGTVDMQGQFGELQSEVPIDRQPDVFIPDGRSVFSTVLQQRTLGFMAAGGDLDPFLLGFGQRQEAAKRWAGSSPSGGLTQSAQDILRGDYRLVSGVDHVEMQDGRQVPLTHASSGQQEALPLLLVLAHLSDQKREGGYMLFVEEPESHLFPSAQHALVQRLVQFRAQNPGSRLFITTHSPYVLSTLNNLLMAGQLQAGGTDVGDVVAPDLQLSPGSLRAYALGDGGIRDLMDAETGLIDAGYLDQVSEDLDAQFDALLDRMPE